MKVWIIIFLALLHTDIHAQKVHSTQQVSKTIKVLSIDGGGVRGIIAAKILTKIEKKTNKSISENFDIIIGNSTGALLALGLSTPNLKKENKYTALDLVNFYHINSKNIFYSNTFRKLFSGFGLWAPKYSRDNLDSILKELFGETKLSELLCNIIVTSYNLKSGLPHIWTSYLPKTDNDFYLYDIAGATSSAPTFFSPKEIYKGDKLYSIEVDGGLYANNPAAVLLSEINNIYNKKINHDDILFISIGTGRCGCIKNNYSPTYGIVSWLSRQDLISTMIDANSEIVDSQMSGMFKNYIRLQIENLPQELMALDNGNVENLQKLEKLADQYIEKNFDLINKVCNALNN